MQHFWLRFSAAPSSWLTIKAISVLIVLSRKHPPRGPERQFQENSSLSQSYLKTRNDWNPKATRVPAAAALDPSDHQQSCLIEWKPANLRRRPESDRKRPPNLLFPTHRVPLALHESWGGVRSEEDERDNPHSPNGPHRPANETGWLPLTGVRVILDGIYDD